LGTSRKWGGPTEHSNFRILPRWRAWGGCSDLESRKPAPVLEFRRGEIGTPKVGRASDDFEAKVTGSWGVTIEFTRPVGGKKQGFGEVIPKF